MGLSMISDEGGWAVGTHGEIMSYGPPSPTPIPTATPVPVIPLAFRDVHPTDYFYDAVRFDKFSSIFRSQRRN